MITELKDNQIFVFGSNLRGYHGAGAAKQAFDQFGAEWGIGEGLTGRCYALPTLDENMQQDLEMVQRAVNQFLDVATENPDLEFLVTKVGCGIAGYDEGTIKGLFTNMPKNVVLPDDWNQPQRKVADHYEMNRKLVSETPIGRDNNLVGCGNCIYGKPPYCDNCTQELEKK